MPEASTAVQALIALARASPTNVAWIRLSTCGSITAAAMPWMTRNVTSWPVFWATPHASEASVNPASPALNSRSWPRIRPRRAPATSSTA